MELKDKLSTCKFKIGELRLKNGERHFAGLHKISNNKCVFIIEENLENNKSSLKTAQELMATGISDDEVLLNPSLKKFIKKYNIIDIEDFIVIDQPFYF